MWEFITRGIGRSIIKITHFSFYVIPSRKDFEKDGGYVYLSSFLKMGDPKNSDNLAPTDLGQLAANELVQRAVDIQKPKLIRALFIFNFDVHLPGAQ